MNDYSIYMIIPYNIILKSRLRLIAPDLDLREINLRVDKNIFAAKIVMVGITNVDCSGRIGFLWLGNGI